MNKKKWKSNSGFIPYEDSIIEKPRVLKDKYPNFEVGLKCIIMVF